MKIIPIRMLLSALTAVAGNPIGGGGPGWHHGSSWWKHWPPGSDYPPSGSGLPPVTQAALEASISTEALMKMGQELEDIAYSTPDRNRVIGSLGHQRTLDWVAGYLDQMSHYYTYELQPFKALYYHGGGTLTVFGNEVGIVFEYSPSGSVEAEFVEVDNLGCKAKDCPDAVAGNITLMSRGECEFGLRSALAGAAGAAAAVIYKDVGGPIGSGTLVALPRPEGPYIPTIGIAKDKGERILDALPLTGAVEVTADMRNITTCVPQNRDLHPELTGRQIQCRCPNH